MARPLRDSVVVITGASSGIGRATALAFARQGASLVLGARREAVLRDVAGECDRLGARAIACATDVTDEEAVRTLARRAIETFGRIDVWVNNAAVTMFGRFEEAPADAFRRVLETNVLGYVHGARAALPQFREQGTGVLVNVGSVTSRVAQPYASAYTMSKHAVASLSESLRQELLDAPGIHVVTIMPASVDTPLFQHAANYTGRAVQPMAPVYDAEQVAEAIVRAAGSPRREIFVGNAGRAMAAMRTAAPGLGARIIARQVHRRHFQDASAERSRGNLFEPVDYGTGVSGGWTRGTSRGTGVATLAITALGLGALGWMLWRSGAARAAGERLPQLATREGLRGLAGATMARTAAAGGLLAGAATALRARASDLGTDLGARASDLGSRASALGARASAVASRIGASATAAAPAAIPRRGTLPRALRALERSAPRRLGRFDRQAPRLFGGNGLRGAARSALERLREATG